MVHAGPSTAPPTDPARAHRVVLPRPTLSVRMLLEGGGEEGEAVLRELRRLSHAAHAARRYARAVPRGLRGEQRRAVSGKQKTISVLSPGSSQSCYSGGLHGTYINNRYINFVRLSSHIVALCERAIARAVRPSDRPWPCAAAAPAALRASPAPALRCARASRAPDPAAPARPAPPARLGPATNLKSARSQVARQTQAGVMRGILEP